MKKNSLCEGLIFRKNIFPVLLLLAPCFFQKLCAQADLRLIYEKNFSEQAGAEDLYTLHHIFKNAENKILPVAPFKKGKRIFNVLNAGFRVAKTFAIDYPVDFFTGEVQHEVFGHGARFRELGYTNCSYHISFPFPYGNGHGFSIGYPSHFTRDEDIVMITGGVESQYILADLMRNRWISSGVMYPSDFFLYAGDVHGLTFYIYRTCWQQQHHEPTGGGNDMLNYVLQINAKYYAAIQKGTKPYSLNDLATYAALDFADPFQLILFWKWLSSIATGNEKMNVPMVHLGLVHYLPAGNIGLSPFGMEFCLHNYIKWKRKTADIYGRIGDTRFQSSFGFGLRTFNVLSTGNCFLNARAEAWRQPSLALSAASSVRMTTTGWGGCLTLDGGIRLFPKLKPLYADIQAGYKTDGFLPGEALAKGFFIRAGLGFDFF